MKRSLQKGNIVEWLLVFLTLSVVIFAIIVPKSGSRGFIFSFPAYTPSSSTPAPFSDYQYGGSSNQNSYSGIQSRPTVTSTGFTGVSSGPISLSSGNAAYSYQPMEEYIAIENHGNQAVNITGWRLENANSQKTYFVGDNALHYASATAIVPQGTHTVSPSGASSVSNIILNPGENAIVVSGSPGNLSPYRLVSFKENKCTGYLAETYSFPMGLQNSCIRPSVEPGVQSLDRECQNYIETIPACHTPKFDTVDAYGNKVDSKGNTCQGCADGKALSGLCSNFIKSHFSYAGCLWNHQNDSDFEGHTWHVYLYRPWEMWAASHETIFLYDNLNRLQAYYSY